MKSKIDAYKRKLEKAMCEYMDQGVSDRYVESIKNMAKCWDEISEMEESMGDSHADSMTHDDIKCWNDKMKNADGTTGGHWTVDQTTSVASSYGVYFEHLDEMDWNVTLNMMYSDYCDVAKKMNVNNIEFYVCMAKAFLFDPDGPGPEKKLGAYYHGIVCGKVD